MEIIHRKLKFLHDDRFVLFNYGYIISFRFEGSEKDEDPYQNCIVKVVDHILGRSFNS
jgi:hypothetical protein